LKEARNEVPESRGQVGAIPKSLKILLAEDNLINQKVARLTLKQFGLDCDVANDGIEAFDLFKKNSYELVLMDMQMPKVDGLQATVLIRAHEKENLIQSKPAYIVALTANAMSEDKQRCLLSGMNDFLSKPFSEKEFSHILIEAGKRLGKN
jgi:CheY-like chemotaxis protein